MARRLTSSTAPPRPVLEPALRGREISFLISGVLVRSVALEREVLQSAGGAGGFVTRRASHSDRCLAAMSGMARRLTSSTAPGREPTLPGREISFLGFGEALVRSVALEVMLCRAPAARVDS